jgi:hypothetical protein
VFELINNLVETTPSLTKHFVNTFTLDILLKIFENYGENELKVSALEIILQLCKENNAETREIIFIFKKLGGP